MHEELKARTLTLWERCWKQVTPLGFVSVQTSIMLLASDSLEGLIVERFMSEKAWCKIPSLAAQARRFAGLEEQVAQLSQEKGNPLLVVMEFIQPNSCTTLTKSICLDIWRMSSRLRGSLSSNLATSDFPNSARSSVPKFTRSVAVMRWIGRDMTLCVANRPVSIRQNLCLVWDAADFLR